MKWFGRIWVSIVGVLADLVRFVEVFRLRGDGIGFIVGMSRADNDVERGAGFRSSSRGS